MKATFTNLERAGLGQGWGIKIRFTSPADQALAPSTEVTVAKRDGSTSTATLGELLRSSGGVEFIFKEATPNYVPWEWQVAMAQQAAAKLLAEHKRGRQQCGDRRCPEGQCIALSWLDVPIKIVVA